MPETRLQVVEPPGPYVYFALSAFAITLLGGPLVGILLWASRSGTAFRERQPVLIQAHGWTQLAGWAGLFVAGFSLRLLPRFAGRPEKSPRISITILGILVAGILLRIVGSMFGGSIQGLAAAGELVTGAGILGVALRQVAVLKSNRNGGAPWSMLAWMGAAWWGGWAMLIVFGAAVSRGTGTVPSGLDRATVWAVTLGAIGNFIWAIQSRMMPTSFGRPAPGRKAVLVPALVYNLGATIALTAGLGVYAGELAPVWPIVRSVGLGVAGAGMIWLAWTCGALHGQPDRLRPASQPLGRFILWANRWAVAGGALLVLSSLRDLLPAAVARLDLEDAALHAVEVGLVTILIAGMLQLVAPVFAMERMGREPRQRFAVTVWALLMTATLARVVAALVPPFFGPLAGLSGLSGWLGLALLAGALLRASATRARTPG